ncbi:MAG TPA: hypothetical protein VE093_23130 [Polyangiaceae bacterium]|nr:hypothetical protein [Polyangiaceae bacterium]
MDDEREDEDETLADVEVERMPNLDGWEYFKAVDGAEERDRWTIAIQPKPGQTSIEYALWTDIKGDPAAFGVLDANKEASKRWVKAVRRAVEGSGSLDNDARAEVVLAILRQHDSTLDSYEDRLLFTLEPPPDEDDEDDEDAEDDEDDSAEDAEDDDD